MITINYRHIALIFCAIIGAMLVNHAAVAAVNTSQAFMLSPYTTVETSGMKLFKRISDSQQELQKSPEKMRDIIEQELMPVIDHQYTAYKILGSHLRKTTKEQRKNFALAMRQYLVTTYAKALNNYQNQKVIFEPHKDVTNKKITAVNAKIIEPNKPEINIAFMLRKNRKTQQWKVFDMVVEGISLLTTKKSELSQRIAKQGIDQVSLELAAIAK